MPTILEKPKILSDNKKPHRHSIGSHSRKLSTSSVIRQFHFKYATRISEG